MQGSHYEHGKRIGEYLKKEIQSRLSVWEAILLENTDQTSKEVIALLKKNTGLLQAIETHTPALLTEISGMAAGADVQYERLLSYNLAEEIMTYYSQSYESCTNIAAHQADATIIAYNLDIPDFLQGNRKPLLVNHSKGFVMSFPGIIATTVINHEFMVTTNSLPMLRMNTDGLPLPFLLRKLAGITTLEQANGIIRSVPLAIPQNLMLVSRERIHDIEVSANQQSEYQSPQHSEVIFHTNFPLVNTDFVSDDEPVLECERFERLTQRFSATAVTPSDITIKEAIISVQDEETFATVIAKYPTDINQLPTIEVLNPNDGNRSTQLFTNNQQKATLND